MKDSKTMLTNDVTAVLINTPMIKFPSYCIRHRYGRRTGADHDEKKAAEYGHEIYLISDEPYREIVFEGVDGTVHREVLSEYHHLLLLQQIAVPSWRENRLCGSVTEL